MELMLNLVLCCLKNKKSHIINDAVKLDCGKSACKSCLKSGNKCNNCGKIHTENGNYLPDSSIDVLLKVQKVELINHLKQKIDVYKQSLDVIIQNRFVEIQDQINNKAEEMKKEIDVIKENLITQVKSIKQDYIDKINYVNKDEINDTNTYLNNCKCLLDKMDHLKNNIVFELDKTALSKPIIAKFGSNLNASILDAKIKTETENESEIRKTALSKTIIGNLDEQNLHNSSKTKTATTRNHEFNKCKIMDTAASSVDNTNEIEKILGNVNLTELLSHFRDTLISNGITFTEFQKMYFRRNDKNLTYFVYRAKVIDNNDCKLTLPIARKLSFINDWLKNTKNIQNYKEYCKNLPLTAESKRKLKNILFKNKISQKQFATKVLNVSQMTFNRILMPKIKTRWQHHYNLINKWMNDENKMDIFKDETDKLKVEPIDK